MFLGISFLLKEERKKLESRLFLANHEATEENNCREKRERCRCRSVKLGEAIRETTRAGRTKFKAPNNDRCRIQDAITEFPAVSPDPTQSLRAQEESSGD